MKNFLIFAERTKIPSEDKLMNHSMTWFCQKRLICRVQCLSCSIFLRSKFLYQCSIFIFSEYSGREKQFLALYKIWKPYWSAFRQKLLQGLWSHQQALLSSTKNDNLQNVYIASNVNINFQTICKLNQWNFSWFILFQNDLQFHYLHVTKAWDPSFAIH